MILWPVSNVHNTGVCVTKTRAIFSKNVTPAPTRQKNDRKSPIRRCKIRKRNTGIGTEKTGIRTVFALLIPVNV